MLHMLHGICKLNKVIRSMNCAPSGRTKRIVHNFMDQSRVCGVG